MRIIVLFTNLDRLLCVVVAQLLTNQSTAAFHTDRQITIALHATNSYFIAEAGSEIDPKRHLLFPSIHPGVSLNFVNDLLVMLD